MPSLAQELAAMDPAEIESVLQDLDPAQMSALMYEWRFWARPEQLAPAGDWLTWVIMAGRGAGKTRSGSEWVREQVYAGRQRIALVAETYKDLVEVMCFGDSGIESVFPPSERPVIVCNPNVTVKFHTGAVALGYNATQPGQLRGPQFDAAWVDEFAKYKKPQELWDMLQFGLRLGERPQSLVTTTPRNVPALIKILDRKKTVQTHGHTRDNAGNLAESFMEEIYDRYQGTRLGRQELAAELLTEVTGALWRPKDLDDAKAKLPDPKGYRRIVVSVDPSGAGSATEETADEIGIVVAALRTDGHYEVLEDATLVESPAGWAAQAIKMLNKYSADMIVAEKNYGGAMVEHTIRSVEGGRDVKILLVTASRGKVVRAEPIAALYEQGKVRHVGNFPELEDQMTQMTLAGYQGEQSPDRVDALVWALSALKDGSSYSVKGSL